MRPGKKLTPMEGTVFGKLTVVSFYGMVEAYDQKGVSLWNCVCECGGESIVRRRDLVTGNTKSCGCLRKRS